METNQKLELVDQAIQRLLAEKKTTGASADNDRLLSNLLSQLELSKTKALVEQEEINSTSVCEAGLENERDEDGSNAENGAEEIMKELRQVKRQNVITHCLLSALIALTLAWQVSEVSLIMKLKDGVTHPFKSLGGMLLGMFKVSGRNGQDAERQHSTEPHLHMPELPHVDLGSRNG